MLDKDMKYAKNLLSSEHRGYDRRRAAASTARRARPRTSSR
jgi:hypothetical protein